MTSDLGAALVPVHVAATLFMAGVIWFVQVVHYPLMDGVGRDGFADYEDRHTRRTTWVVAPPMLIEAGTAVALALRPGNVPPTEAWAGLVLVAAAWITTALVQVPCHRRLAAGFDPATHRRLVATNWIRVAAWSARAALVASWLG